MKIKVQKEAFLKALQKVSNIIGSRTTLPVLANILMDAKDDQLTLTTTDLELRLTTTVAAVVEEPGVTTLPAKKLLGLVSKFHQGEVSITSNENFHSEIKCGTVSITLLGLNPDDFPVAPEFEVNRNVKIKQSELAMILERISYAANLDDSRKVLTGILFSLRDSKITAVATDGKRLALCERPLEEAPTGEDGDIIITLKAANELKRLIGNEGDVTMEIGEKQITFRVNETVIVSKLIEGTYPNYRQVIPTSFKTTIELPADPFIYAIEILSVTLSEASSPYIKLTFDANKLLFEANSSIGEGSEAIDVAYEGDKMSASFNPNFLLDPFKHLPVEKVLLKINDVVSPIAIESNDGFLYVIMPMRNKG